MSPPSTSRPHGLAETFKALAHPARLSLLEHLQKPRVLKEIRVTVDEDGPRERPLARQTVRRHLDKLLEQDLALARSTSREFGETQEFLVDNQRVYALAQILEDLAELRPEDEPARETLQLHSSQNEDTDVGPGLVLVKGVSEGTVFALEADEDDSPWMIGRNRSLAVPLDFDPFVSAENTVLRYRDGTFLVEDLPRSRNGTRVNYEPLTSGRPEPLSDGDLISVGETTFLFRR